MLSNIALFFANRAASGAVGSISRWASWGAVAALFCTCGVVFGTIALYLSIEPIYGAITSAAMIAAGSLLLGLACLAAPPLLDHLERQAAQRAKAEVGPLASTVKAANEETAAAVDYFGPLQVVASAFLVGMRTAQQFQGKPHKAT